MTIYDLLVPTFQQMLKGLQAQLAKAEAFAAEHGLAEDALPQARLAPDMFPLNSQVRYSCQQVYEALARLNAVQSPAIGECADSLPALQEHIAQTLAALDAVDRASLDGPGDRAVSMTLPNGMTFRLTADQYVRDWALPQLYFHLVAAYMILRAQGVPVGKQDFVSHMFAYFQAPTAA